MDDAQWPSGEALRLFGLYAISGEPCEGDPYTIPGVPRHVSKPILNIVLNAKTGTSAVRAAAGELKRTVGGSQGERHARARAIIAALKERNKPIAEFFHSDVGKWLMEHESRLLGYNMLALMKLQIPFVPLHDALLVPERKLPVLERIMEDNLALYREVLTEGGHRIRNRASDLRSDAAAESIS